MTARRVARALVFVLDVVVLVASGVYLVVYLYRWEWNRAVVSGIFFVTAEVAMVAMLLFSRLARLERRIGEPPAIAADAWRSDREHERPFAWLEDGTGVFVPVLLGVGAILTAIAYVVEHVAAATAPARGASGSPLSAIEPPHAALAPPTDLRIRDDLTRAPREPASGRISSVVVASLAGALLLAAIVVFIAGVTQNRPDLRYQGEATTFDLAISVRDHDVGPLRVANALWVSCRVTVPHEVEGSLQAVGPYVRVRLEPAIGHNARRRFVGCLQDLTVEGALARVVTWETVSPG